MQELNNLVGGGLGIEKLFQFLKSDQMEGQEPNYFRFCFSIPLCAFIVISKASTARRQNRTRFCTRVLFSLLRTHTKCTHKAASYIREHWTQLSFSHSYTFEWTNTHRIISKYPINTIGYVLSERKELRKNTRVYGSMHWQQPLPPKEKEIPHWSWLNHFCNLGLYFRRWLP